MTGTAPNLESPHAAEVHGYLTVAGESVYTVFHDTVGARRGVVLIAGPFNAERERAYPVLVRWARTLAARGFAVLRFDYRGLGESTGRFEGATIATWREDVMACFDRCLFMAAGAPVILHGARMGALLAANAFAQCPAAGLLLWSPPASASEHLSEMLRRAVMSDMIANPGGARRTREQYTAEIDSGFPVNVDGYFWTRALLASADGVSLRRPSPDERRPWLSVGIRSPGAPTTDLSARVHERQIDAAKFWDGSGWIVPSSAAFISESLAWLDAHFPSVEAP